MGATLNLYIRLFDVAFEHLAVAHWIRTIVHDRDDAWENEENEEDKEGEYTEGEYTEAEYQEEKRSTPKEYEMGFRVSEFGKG